MPIECDEASVAELRRGAQLAGAERGRRASNAGEVGFDRIKTFGQRQRSGETRVLDAEAGLGGPPAGGVTCEPPLDKFCSSPLDKVEEETDDAV